MMILMKHMLSNLCLPVADPCIADQWKFQAETKCDDRLLHPSGLRYSALLSHTEPLLQPTAAGHQSTVQLLPEEHSFPGLTIT